MVKKNRFPAFIKRLLINTGGRYPFLILLYSQIINTVLMLLLTAMPAQQNAEFSKSQGISLLIFGGVALLLRNTILLLQFSHFNQDMFTCLSKLNLTGTVCTEPEQEKRAWEQATSATKYYIFFEYMELLALVLAPTLAYGYFSLHISIEQLVYLSLATMAAGLTNVILENLTLNQLFEPIIQALLPKQFETQLAGIKGMHLWSKLSLAIFGLVMINLFLVVPTAYHQTRLITSQISPSPQALTNALLLIVNSGIGAVVVGIFLSFQLISYFSNPFRKMINLFSEVESGDLSRRIEVSLPDEFGSLNIHINHMIGRLQLLTSTLEQQVADRTSQLSKVNEELQVELTERKRTQEQLSYTSLHDPLTNLPNRVLFMDRLKHAMKRARRHKNFTFAVIFLDLDGFKVVNDSLGHSVGDLLLVESARRLTDCLRGEDSVARLGGDEFVILIEEVEGSTVYKNIAKRIRNNLALPADLSGHKVYVSVSMGIVLSDARYERPEDIVRDADIAMYHAKRQGRGRYEIFDTTMLDNVMTRLELETDLRKALENQEFIVHYQPIINLGTHQIVGFEALIRWQHPTRGLTPPADFIPIAEEIGLIVPIGYWVLDEACQQIGVWQEQYPADPPLTVNVNISIKQCAELDFVEKIVEILQKNKLAAGCLKLELAESLIVENSKYISTMLLKLNELGIQVQIGEFGTGYSLLGYLHTLPIDTLKIDRTFISRLGTKHDGSEIVQTILTLAHSFGMKVIAEGVETDEQLSKLKAMDCEYVQGFLFAKAVDSQEAGALLGKPFAEFDE